MPGTAAALGGLMLHERQATTTLVIDLNAFSGVMLHDCFDAGFMQQQRGALQLACSCCLAHMFVVCAGGS